MSARPFDTSIADEARAPRGFARPRRFAAFLTVFRQMCDACRGVLRSKGRPV